MKKIVSAKTAPCSLFVAGLLCLMPSEAVSARPLCEYLLHLAIRPFLLTLMLTYTPPDARPPAKTHENRGCCC